MAYDGVGSTDLKGENISKAVRGYALKKQKLKQVCLEVPSTNWTESYFREHPTILTAFGNRSVGQVARGALPPEVNPTWEKDSQDHFKFMAQDHVFYEDSITDAISVQRRTFIRVGEAVADAVDTYIYSIWTGVATTAGTVAASDDWNSVTLGNRDSIGDILKGIAAIELYNYDVRGKASLVLRPTDYANLLQDDRVIKNPSFKSADVVTNGKVAKLLDLQIITSTSVSLDECMILVNQVASTYKSAVAIKSAVIPDPGVNIKIRSWEIGQCIVTDPYAMYTITNINVAPV